jgi:hypothetical protein
VAVGGVLFGVDGVGAGSAAVALALLAVHVVRSVAGSAAPRLLGAGLLLLAAAAASRLWRPVTVTSPPSGSGGLIRTWTVPSLAGERLTGMLVLLAVTVLEVAVYLLPGGRRSPWTVVAVVVVSQAPLVLVTKVLLDTAARSRWPLPADPWPLVALVLPALLAAVLCGVSAAAGVRRRRGRLPLAAGALLLEAAIVAEVLRAAGAWSLVTIVSTPPGQGGLSTTLGYVVLAQEPTLAERLLDPHPWPALFVAVALAGPALLALGAGRAARDGGAVPAG